jgi:hypothetical protein
MQAQVVGDVWDIACPIHTTAWISVEARAEHS